MIEWCRHASGCICSDALPQLPVVIVFSAFSAVILGFQFTKIAGADRRFDQKRLVQIELASQLIALGAMIVLVWQRGRFGRLLPEVLSAR